MRKVDTEVEADYTKVDVITPIFSGLETESISESAALLEFESVNSSNKIGFSLSGLANLSSVKTVEGGFTAGGPHLNGADL